jgi:hypothetical protein
MAQMVKYSGASANAKKKFLEPKRQGKDDRNDGDDREEFLQQQQQWNPILTGAFEIINPIETCLGPIGQFILKPENFPLHPSILFYGKRRTGKSHSARWILSQCFRDYEFGICCTGTYYNQFWQQYMPTFLVFEGLNDAALTMMIRRQIGLIEAWLKKHPNGDYKAEKSLRAFIILGK